MPQLPTFALVALSAALIGTHASSVPSPVSADQAAVMHHLDGALEMLAARDLSALTASQRTNRAAAVALLAAYRDAGAFPQNRDYPGTRVPYFVDPVTDVHCAVGHLMAATGHQSMVRRIAAADNHVRVKSLATDAGVQAWLESNGISLDEAARIQPTYGEPPPREPPESRVSNRQLTATIGAAAGVSLMHLLRVDGSGSRPVGVGSVFVGALGVGTALYATDRPAARFASLLFGAAAAHLGFQALRADQSTRTREVDDRSAPLRLRWSVAPVIEQRGLSLTARLRF